MKRDPDEVLYFQGKRVGPKNVEAMNPAFDITPPELVSGIVTDRGIARPPLERSLRFMAGAGIAQEIGELSGTLY